jgi:hypothetical protein
MSKMMVVYLAIFKARLAKNQGIPEANQIVIDWLEDYISKHK